MQIEKASTQYNDLVGSASLDFHGGTDSSLHQYARLMGVDTEIYHPIGLGFYIGESGGFYLKFFCVDQQNREQYASENRGAVPIVLIRRKENMANFLRQVKRFDVVLSQKNGFPNHEITKEMDEDDSIEDVTD